VKLSLFSVSYAGFWGQHRLEVQPFIRKAAQLGYDTVMLAGKRPHLSPLDATDERIEAIRATLTENRIQCAVVGAYTDLSGAGPAEVPQLEIQIAYVEALARLASRLGASVVRVFTAYEGSAPTLEIWRRVVASLREMCDRAAAHGVTIAVQNHHDVAVHTDALVELLLDVDRPNCKLGFDAWSPALRGEDLYEAARKMAPHTAITTNADYIRLPRYRLNMACSNYEPAVPDLVRAVKLGEGFIDYPAFFAGLVDGGFDGISSYELCWPIRGGGSEENLDAYARHYLEWMKENVLGKSRPDGKKSVRPVYSRQIASEER
jgi:sugar phosphate isomerase/epimerase